MFRGKIVEGHNNVTKYYQGAEGLKTGYHSKSGYNLATVATKNNKSLFAVVTGGKTASLRDQKMIKLLDNFFRTKTIQICRINLGSQRYQL